MNILIPDIWLRDFLKTQATARQIAECLSLCGPSVEKLENGVYSIEVTTNRIDAASVWGIAREAAAILNQFGIDARLRPPETGSLLFRPRVSYLKAEVDTRLCFRFSAVLVKDVKLQRSPEWLINRLTKVGVRPINNVVDISNYIMHELGQPVHTFDYDKIGGHYMKLRESKKGERLTTLDGKIHILPGGDIVIEDGDRRLIDLAGIMGGENSAVDDSTKNVLLFVQTYNPKNIRRTSMILNQRTEAALLFEKGLDPEQVSLGIARGIDLFKELTNGSPEEEILDIYPLPYKTAEIQVDLGFIRSRLGIQIEKKQITKILGSLGFTTSWNRKILTINVPSFRAGDTAIPEDIVEEVARIYGYHRLPNTLMEGPLPEPLSDSPFPFEIKLKNIIKGFGGVEVYTLSLVSRDFVERNALKLKNPLGLESEYLRTSLRPSLVEAANANVAEKEEFHLFEMANIYLPRKGMLPEEKMMLGGIFSSTDFRKARGIVESFLEEINVNARFVAQELPHFLPSRSLAILSGDRQVGALGILNERYIYYEFSVEDLRKLSQARTFIPLPKYPPQIEDLTLTFPEKTKIGEVISSIKSISKLVNNVEMVDIYDRAFTFRIWYQHPTKTLTDKEVGKIRNKILRKLNRNFGGDLKD